MVLASTNQPNSLPTTVFAFDVQRLGAITYITPYHNDEGD